MTFTSEQSSWQETKKRLLIESKPIIFKAHSNKLEFSEPFPSLPLYFEPNFIWKKHAVLNQTYVARTRDFLYYKSLKKGNMHLLNKGITLHLPSVCFAYLIVVEFSLKA
jgi:hypothetical protein